MKSGNGQSVMHITACGSEEGRTWLPETLISQNLEEDPSTHSRRFSIASIRNGRKVQSFNLKDESSAACVASLYEYASVTREC